MEGEEDERAGEGRCGWSKRYESACGVPERCEGRAGEARGARAGWRGQRGARPANWPRAASSSFTVTVAAAFCHLRFSLAPSPTTYTAAMFTAASMSTASVKICATKLALSVGVM